jgi:pimeloyl-ACP methyl ester carboxylesterase
MYRTYALDLWGYGDTAKNTERYSLDQQVELLETFLTEMGIAKVACIGHGLGALVALLFAEKESDRVDRIMAVGLPLKDQMINTSSKYEDPNQLADRLLNDSIRAKIPHTEVLKTDPQVHQVLMNNLQGPDLLNQSHKLDTPCLLVYGEDDPVIRMSEVRNFNPLTNSIHTIIFEESGHYPMLDQASTFHRLLQKFLTLKSGENLKEFNIKDKWTRRVR